MPSRRSFLRIGGVAGLASALSSLFPEFAQAVPRKPKGGNPPWYNQLGVVNEVLDDSRLTQLRQYIQEAALAELNPLGPVSASAMAGRRTMSNGTTIDTYSEYLSDSVVLVVYVEHSQAGAPTRTMAMEWLVNEGVSLDLQKAGPSRGAMRTRTEASVQPMADCPWGTSLCWQCGSVDWGCVVVGCMLGGICKYARGSIPCLVINCPVALASCCTSASYTCCAW